MRVHVAWRWHAWREARSGRGRGAGARQRAMQLRAATGSDAQSRPVAQLVVMTGNKAEPNLPPYQQLWLLRMQHSPEAAPARLPPNKLPSRARAEFSQDAAASPPRGLGWRSERPRGRQTGAVPLRAPRAGGRGGVARAGGEGAMSMQSQCVSRGRQRPAVDARASLLHPLAWQTTRRLCTVLAAFRPADQRADGPAPRIRRRDPGARVFSDPVRRQALADTPRRRLCAGAATGWLPKRRVAPTCRGLASSRRVGSPVACCCRPPGQCRTRAPPSRRPRGNR